MKTTITRIIFVAISIFIFWASMWATTSLALIEEPSFIEPTEAFQPNIIINEDALEITWRIAPGYFLYRHSLGLNTTLESTTEESTTENTLKGTPKGKTTNLLFDINTGHNKFDEYLGENVEIYRDNAFMQANIHMYRGQPFRLTLTSQGCADAGLCFPPETYNYRIDSNNNVHIVRNHEVSQTEAHIASSGAKFTDNTSTVGIYQLFTLLLSALLGGLILNLMPCVFPVLSLKALSLATGHSSVREQHQHGWAYTLGVILSFILAASIIMIIRTGGQSLGWGFQLQNPIFISFMAYVFLIMGLSLSGFIEFGGAFMGAGQQLTSGNNVKSSFFTGVLAALVASPCTAPFMATAIGIALTQPVVISLSIFATLGLGMALPFLMLSYFPHLFHFMPKPGAWMDTFKQALAFPLYLTVIWLLWVLSGQTHNHAIFLTLIGMLLLVLGFWLARLPINKSILQYIRNSVMVACFVPSFVIATSMSTDNETERATKDEVFTLERLAFYREQGLPIFVDLTADWCITCKVNERIALTDHIKEQLKQQQIVFLVGDWTNKNEQISRFLAQHKRSGVPLYLMYPQGGGEPELLPQLLTKKIVMSAAERALL